MTDPENNGITLRELNQKLHHERDMVTQQLGEVDRSIKFHAEASERALRLQASEYERRLTLMQSSYEHGQRLSMTVSWVILIGCAFTLLVIVLRFMPKG